jgi:hypothetical protein
MLKKYTKYAATALAVASLSTFMIGCGETTDETPATDIPEPDASGKGKLELPPGGPDMKNPPNNGKPPIGKK